MCALFAERLGWRRVFPLYCLSPTIFIIQFLPTYLELCRQSMAFGISVTPEITPFSELLFLWTVVYGLIMVYAENYLILRGIHVAIRKLGIYDRFTL